MNVGCIKICVFEINIRNFNLSYVHVKTSICFKWRVIVLYIRYAIMEKLKLGHVVVHFLMVPMGLGGVRVWLLLKRKIMAWENLKRHGFVGPGFCHLYVEIIPSKWIIYFYIDLSSRLFGRRPVGFFWYFLIGIWEHWG